MKFRLAFTTVVVLSLSLAVIPSLALNNVERQDGDVSPTPSSIPPLGYSDPCFPADATVELSNGQTKRMDEVQIGDRVQVGTEQFSQVYFFGHKLADGMFDFVELSLENGRKLALTEGHYVIANHQWKRGGDVHVGDFLSDVVDNQQVKVESIRMVQKRGLYNPHTMHGDIVVNGVQASTYADTIHPRLAHMVLLPERVLYILSNHRWSLVKDSFEVKTPAVIAWMIPFFTSL